MSLLPKSRWEKISTFGDFKSFRMKSCVFKHWELNVLYQFTSNPLFVRVHTWVLGGIPPKGLIIWTAYRTVAAITGCNSLCGVLLHKIVYILIVLWRSFLNSDFYFSSWRLFPFFFSVEDVSEFELFSLVSSARLKGSGKEDDEDSTGDRESSDDITRYYRNAWHC